MDCEKGGRLNRASQTKKINRAWAFRAQFVFVHSSQRCTNGNDYTHCTSTAALHIKVAIFINPASAQLLDCAPACPNRNEKKQQTAVRASSKCHPEISVIQTDEIQQPAAIPSSGRCPTRRELLCSRVKNKVAQTHHASEGAKECREQAGKATTLL